MQKVRCAASGGAAALFVLCAVAACGDSATSEVQSALMCPTFSAGVRVPQRLETTFTRISAVTELQPAPWIDESGIYWFDYAGALYALPDGQTTPVTLRAAPANPIHVLRMVGDGTHLFWGEVDLPTPALLGAGPPPPPGRLYAIAKAGGAATLLLDAPTDLLTPLVTVDDRLIVRRSYGSSGLASFAKDGSSSSPLTTNVDTEPDNVIDGKLYWSVPDPKNGDLNGYFYDLWRAGLDGSGAERITRMDGAPYLVTGDVVLWRQQRTHYGPLVLDQNYVMFDARTGCTQPLPALGLTISSDSLADGEHVYWFSFNGLGAVTACTGGAPDRCPAARGPESMPLIRVDLRSGVLEQVDTPGFTATVGNHIVGQTSGRLYVALSDRGLIAIDKP